MDKQNNHSEIISITRIENEDKVKLKIKEKFPQKRKKTLNPFVKVIIFLTFCYLGFQLGVKLVGRYLSSYHSKYQIDVSTKEEPISYQLKPGEVFAPEP